MISELATASSDFTLVKPGPVTTQGFDCYHGTSDKLFLTYLYDAKNQFCFHKASEGATFVDSALARRWPAMRSTGKVIGVYHYFHPGVDPLKQVQNLVKACAGRIQHGDMIWLDWEDTDGVPAKADCDAAIKCLEGIEKEFGIRPGIYSGPYFLKALACDARFLKYSLWIAQYNSVGPTLAKNCPWKTWAFWQFTSTPMDTNKFNGDLAALKRLAGKA